MRKTADSQAHTPPQPVDEPPKKKRRATGALECQLGILLGIGGLIGSRMGRLWVGFDVFSQFTLQFALITLAFAIGWLMPRGKLLTAFVVLVAGLVGIGMWPHLASREPAVLGTAEQGERVLKVASFNTLWVNEDVAAVKAEVERLDADVITLIEMSPVKRPILAELKARYPYQVNCYNVDFCNLAILSKTPILDSSAQSRWDGPPYIRAKLGSEAGGLTVLGVHTIRFPHSRAQLRQVSAMAGLIETIPGHKLVMGDFNSTPFSRILALMESKANLRRLTYLPSWPSQAGLPQIAIDHIFISPGLKALESPMIGEPAGSDHYPVTVRIAVPADTWTLRQIAPHGEGKMSAAPAILPFCDLNRLISLGHSSGKEFAHRLCWQPLNPLS